MNISKTTRRRIAHWLSYLFLGVVGISMVFPLLWMLLTSLKSPGGDALSKDKWLPETAWRLNKYDVSNYVMFCQKILKQTNLFEALPAKTRKLVRNVAARNPAPVPYGAKPKANQLVIGSEKAELLNAFNDLFEKGDLAVALNTSTTSVGDNKSSLPQLTNRRSFDSLFKGLVVPAKRFHWENYKIVIFKINFARALFNSIFVTLSLTFGLVFTSSLAAFAFARLEFPGRDKIFLSYLATMMVPAAVTMIPVFILMRSLGWVNTYSALIFPAMFSAYGTFMLRQFFMSIPKSLEEAAMLDGCSTWGIYYHVVLPLSKPALAALSILTFMGAWRGFMWPLIVTNTRDMFTLPVALAAFKELYGVQWTLMMAGSMIMILPMLLVFLIGQKFFIEGIRLGAVKG